MTSTPRLRIAVVGGGVGGLTLAYALSKCADLHIDVYEAAQRFAEIGAGVGLFWRTQRVLTELGLRDAVTALGSEFNDGYVPAIRTRKSDQPEGEDIGVMLVKGGLTAVHRAEFHDVLLKSMLSAPNVHTATSKRLVSYTQPSASTYTSQPISLTFADGSTASCDVLIGADGLKSPVRASMMEELAREAEDAGDGAKAEGLRDHIRAKFSGLISYRTVIPSERLRELNPEHNVLREPIQYLGKDRVIMAYPISRGRLINVAMFDCRFDQEGAHVPDPWVSKANPRDIAELWQGYEKEVADIMTALQGNDVGRWVVNYVKPLPTFSYGRVAVLGDAAHAMNPMQGAGAGTAIEDAAVLAAVLSHPNVTKETAAKALDAYSRVRIAPAQLVARVSRQNTYYNAMRMVPGESDASGEVTLPELKAKMQMCWETSHARNDPIEEAEKAREIFGKMIRN